MEEQWMVAGKKADFQGIGRMFHIDQVTARIIRNRDLVTEEEIRIFLEGDLSDLPDPHLLKDADRLVDILEKKIQEGRKIRIIGDYDIDGVMSSYILLRALKRVGAKVDAAIPDRVKDGYGLNRNLIEKALEAEIDTILTCDNGIAAIDEIAFAKERGMTVLVTDHHAVPYTEEKGHRQERQSRADAVVNPHRTGCRYPYKELCGAAVAWQVVLILYEKMGIPPEEGLELMEFAAFATIGDVMPLTSVNRILVKEGLKRIHHTKNQGMRALIAQCNLEMEKVNCYQIGFVLGPCINAAGRLETAVLALSLFLAEDVESAVQTASRLVALNEERKKLTLEGVEEAKRQCETCDFDRDPVLVIYLPDVDESIAGIIAGRIREYYYRPTFILTNSTDGVKGSGRSIEEYSMYDEMCKCSSLFTKFGGHPMAAGLSLPEENVEQFRQQINACCPFRAEEIHPKVHIDVPMPVSYVTADLIREFHVLEPFGKDNPKPLFADRNLHVDRMWLVGKNKNVLRLNMTAEQGTRVSAVFFGDVEQFREYVSMKFGEDALSHAFSGRENPVVLSIVYTPEINVYRGQENLQFVIQYYR